MFDDFYTRALVAGVLIAILTAPFGCFVVWKRMAYFGDTMAHSALLGITIALLLDLHIGIGVFVVAIFTALALLRLQSNSDLPNDTLLGILSHSTLALGLLTVGLMTNNSVDVLSYLFGDVLAVGKTDLLLITLTTVIAILLLLLIWKPLLAATVNEEFLIAEGAKPKLVQGIYLLLLAAVIAVTVRIIGVLLITALLVIPAATARRFSSSPEFMALLAAVLGTIAVVLGLLASLHWDTAAGPSIVLASLAVFLLSTLAPHKR